MELFIVYNFIVIRFLQHVFNISNDFKHAMSLVAIVFNE